MSVLFPTDGNPMNPTLATPVLATSKPARVDQIHARLLYEVFWSNSQPPPPPLDEGVSNSLRNFASLAFSCPKWYDVALFFCVSKEDGWDLLNLFNRKRPSLSTYWPFRPRHLWSRQKEIHYQFQFASTNTRYLYSTHLVCGGSHFYFSWVKCSVLQFVESRRTEIYSPCATMTLAVAGKIFPCKAEFFFFFFFQLGTLDRSSFQYHVHLTSVPLLYALPLFTGTQ